MTLLIVVAALSAVYVLAAPAPGPGRARSEPAPPAVDLAVICDLLTAALASGASLPRALAAVGAAAGEERLTRAARALHLGSSWADAWGGHNLGTVLAPAWEDGADPSPLLEQLARSIRANRKASAKAAAARLSVRLVVPVGVCLLPAFVLVGIVPILLSGSTALLG